MTLGSHLQGWVNRSSARLTLAQRSNFSALTAAFYPLWRNRSLSWLSGQPFSLAREAKLFLGLCRPQAGERWLDVGTSAGFYAGVLAQAGCAVLAADLSPAMLEVARRTVHGPVVWALLNLETSGIPDADFDGIVIGATLNETDNPQRLLSECARLLKPGGQLWLMYLSATDGPLQTLLVKPWAGGLNFPEPAEVARALWPLERGSSVQIGAVTFERDFKPAVSQE